MDSVTQIALGAAVGEATLGKKVGRPAVVWGGICGLLPDLDILIPFGDAIKNFTYHRGASHSLLVLTLLTPLIVKIILKRHPDSARYQFRWHTLVFLVFITHILLDCLTVYGTQIFWPLTTPPVMWSTIFIIDPIYSIPLIFGVLAAFRMSRESSTGHFISQVCLVLSSLYLAWTIGVKVHVGNVAKESLDRNKISYNRILTVPSPFNSFLWRILVMDDKKYYEGYYSVFDNDRSVYYTSYKNGKALLKELENHWPVTRLQWFTQGFYNARQDLEKIIITDLRMGTEGGYVFRFQVGEINGGVVEPSKSRRIKSQLPLNMLGTIWKRIWSKPKISST